MKKDNLILEKTCEFSLSFIELYKDLDFKKEYILSKQVLSSGTSVGANVREATAAQSKKLNVHSLKRGQGNKILAQTLKHFKTS